MQIFGLDGLTNQEIIDELERGAKFVVYKYCVSIFILTFQRPSDIYFIRAHESALSRGIGFSLLSLCCGWWGFPWGPIYTIGSFITNFNGGVDVTQDVLATMQAAADDDQLVAVEPL